MSQSHINRQYTVTLFASMVSYALVLVLSLSWLRDNQDSPLRYVIAVLPVFPVIFALIRFMRFLRQIDEMQRRIHFEAFGFSLALTGIITFTVGILENAGLPQFGLIWIFPLQIILWGIGSMLARRRY